jgi:ABC-type Fe3+-hydroxamate transport system substrate-binding protein
VTCAALGAILLAAGSACERRSASSPSGSSPRSKNPAAQDYRIVALSPALAVTLRDIGLEDKIVGRHGWDMVLEKSVPVCGDQAVLDYEALVRVQPTDVLLEWGSRPLPDRLQELAKAHGWKVKNYSLLTLQEIQDAADDLFAMYSPAGAEPKTPEAFARQPWPSDTMAMAWSNRHPPDGFTGAGRILLLNSVEPAAAFGPGSWHAEILDHIGGRPAVTEGAPYITLSTEDVLRLAPDGIVLVRPRAPEAAEAPRPRTVQEARALLGPLGALDVPALRSGRVALLDDPLCTIPSTALVRFADDLAEVLERWEAGGAGVPRATEGH